MRDFFHGWRRKVGCVTLVIAILLTVSWVRSYMRHEGFAFSAFGRKHTVNVWNGYIIWLSHNPFGRPGPYAWSDAISPDVELDFGTLPDSYRLTRRIMPHKNFVIPLTLLSPYLILWKPRKKQIHDA